MIAHFVGGPWNGEDRQVDGDGKPSIFGVKANGITRRYDDPSPIGPTYEEFEYHRVGFCCRETVVVYEYVEPEGIVEIVIRKRVPRSKVEETRAELIRTMILADNCYLHYSGPARD